MLGDNSNAAQSPLKYLAIARSTDHILIASYIPSRSDPASSNYPSTVHEVLTAPDFSSKVSQNNRYRLLGDINAFNFILQNKLIFILITSVQYPERLAFGLLAELKGNNLVTSNYEKGMICNENEMSKMFLQLFKSLVTEYEDPAKKDKVSSVMSKVETVKLTMHENIDGMLRNLDKSEEVERTSAKLQEQARLFDTQARSIKRQEQWKNMKLTIIISGICIIVLIIIIVSLKD